MAGSWVAQGRAGQGAEARLACRRKPAGPTMSEPLTKMHPITLRFSDPALEAGLLAYRVQCLDSWRFIWGVLAVVKLAHVAQLFADAPEAYNIFGDRRAYDELTPEALNNLMGWRWKQAESVILIFVAYVTFWTLIVVENKVHAHALGSRITSLCFLGGFLAHITSRVVDPPLASDSLVPFIDAATQLLFALVAHLVHAGGITKLIACGTPPLAHTIAPVFNNLSWQREVKLCWAAALLGATIGYVMEQSLRSLYLLQRRQLQFEATQATASGAHDGHDAMVCAESAPTTETAEAEVAKGGARVGGLEVVLEALTNQTAAGRFLIVAAAVLLGTVLQVLLAGSVGPLG